MKDSDNVHGFLRNSIPGAIFLLCFGTLLGPYQLSSICINLKAGVIIPLSAYPIGLAVQWIYRACYLRIGEEKRLQHIQAAALLGKNNCDIENRNFNRMVAICIWVYTHGQPNRLGRVAKSEGEESFREWVHGNFSMAHSLGASIFAILFAIIWASILCWPWGLNALFVVVWYLIAYAAFYYRADVLLTLKGQLRIFIKTRRSKIRPVYDSWKKLDIST